MKRIFIVVLLLKLTMLGAMEQPGKPGLVQAYRNWAFARTIAHFTQPQPYNPNGIALEQCRFISLKDLHAELDRKMRNHLLMRYVVTPVVGITSLVAVSALAYRNLQFYS